MSQAVVETITPERALRDLKTAKNVRGVGIGHMKALARAMASGSWRLNGETVKYDTNRVLVDGQHRFHACVEAGVPFATYVVYGLTPGDVVEVDTGRRRMADQVLRKSGIAEAKALAGAARLMHMFQAGNLGGWKDARINLSTTEIVDVVDKHPGLLESVRRAQAAGRLTGLSLIAFVHYAGSREFPEQADSFVDGIATGTDLCQGSPMLVLRERFLNSRARNQTLGEMVRRAIVVKAWNAHVQDRTVGALKWGSDESFPTAIFSRRDLP